jgi:hypothetical protein
MKQQGFHFIRALLALSLLAICQAWSSYFTGTRLPHGTVQSTSYLYMRKQKASDKRTSRRQREGPQLLEVIPTITASPMQHQAWTQKVVPMIQEPPSDGGGRQRSRKRSNLYNQMARYHNTFLNALTLEYKAEVRMDVIEPVAPPSQCLIHMHTYRKSKY